jgi:hypothetical protein
MKDLDEFLESLREEDIDPAALVQVRQRVLDRLEKRGRRWWPVWLAAAACAVVLAGAILSPRLQPAPAIPVALKLPQAPPAAYRTASVFRAATVRERSSPAASPPLPSRLGTVSRLSDPQPLLIKVVTDDPDVVIYWIVEKGD